MSISNNSKNKLWHYCHSIVLEEYELKILSHLNSKRFLLLLFISSFHVKYFIVSCSLFTQAKTTLRFWIFVCDALYIYRFFSPIQYNFTRVFAVHRKKNAKAIHNPCGCIVENSRYEHPYIAAYQKHETINVLPFIDYKSVGHLNYGMWVTTAFQIWICFVLFFFHLNWS